MRIVRLIGCAIMGAALSLANIDIVPAMLLVIGILLVSLQVEDES